MFFAVDGDPEARALAGRLAAAWGGTAAEVPAEARPLYHFAATLAAGGVVTCSPRRPRSPGCWACPRRWRGATWSSPGEPWPPPAGPWKKAGPSPRPSPAPPPAATAATLASHLEALRPLAPGKLPLAMFLALETLRQTGQGEEPS